MKLFGRPIGAMLAFVPARAPELEAVELVADPATLRRLAAFLEDVAAEMEAKGSGFQHVHLLDAWNAYGTEMPDIVISPLTGAPRVDDRPLS